MYPKPLKAGKLYPCIHFQSSMNHKSQEVKATQTPSLAECINKIWRTPTTGQYSALKRKDILTPVIIWMNLENTMLSEKRKQSHKDKRFVSTYLGDLEESDSQTQRRTVVVRG